jgi:hypothetical protein
VFALKRQLSWGAREAKIGILLLVAAWCGVVEPAAAAKKAHTGPVVTYTGLKVLGDGSVAFRVELSTSAVVVAKGQGKRVSFLIEDAKVARRNNMNPLEAAFFCVNLVKAQLSNTKRGVMVNLDLRDAAPVTFHLEAVAEGALLEFSVPPGKSGASCK